ncbi:hypothetical protein A9264_14140 [Vibrio sp. UCD-FRSSP16_10]|uniref:TPR domain-containing protein n=1 Tax=unclassified Vibrio TaxID=2614977 RepID=UPI0008018EA4|nr:MULTISPECIES: hypothetical protein [unclassified Vibrio]OBT13249.1 hypothetical protein A9260_14520 [Vibrio sp. UCD-FRSSP16_30]OBT19599.1 hypothetical protein A9264_14140 [Vibrio sp. UCD-FRSSP16_10]
MLTTYSLLIGLLLLTACISYAVLRARLPNKQSLILSSATTSVLFILTLSLWQALRDNPPAMAEVSKPQTIQQIMEQKQQHLTQNRNDQKAWFELGQLYMTQYQFDSAATCFNYSIRLANAPYGGQFAALASALYYQHSQTITPEVQRLLNMTLEMDPFNETALQLIASDHFLSARYQQAITHWTMILDSNHLGVDRVKIITHIKQAQAFLSNSSS